jgi:hypothetical protein
MKPKTQIKLGWWTAIVWFILTSLIVLYYTFVVLWSFRITPPELYDKNVLLTMLFGIPIGLCYCLIFGAFIFAVGRRLFKTSLFFLIAGTVLDLFLRTDWHPLSLVFLVVITLLLSQAIIGMYREMLAQKSVAATTNPKEQKKPKDEQKQ